MKRNTSYLAEVNNNRFVVLLFISLTIAISVEAKNFNEHFDSPSATPEWSGWSPRQALAPKFAPDPNVGHSGAGSLRLKSDAESDFGAWRRSITDIRPGENYTFSAWYRPLNIRWERRSVIARLEWLDDKGEAVSPPEYAIDTAAEGEWKQVSLRTLAPKSAAKLDVQLSLAFSKDASLWWDDVSLATVPADEGRVAKVSIVCFRPAWQQPSSGAAVEEFCRIAAKAIDDKPDVVCLPEGITVINTGKNYFNVGEPIPGPTTARLGKLAKLLHSYVVAALYEKDGTLLYNTAVLIGRDGKLVGKYRKTHLPREEWEAGITPGNDYPVFKTDFGTVGIIICWDMQFPEPARAMALKGAELILMPTWGGNEILAKARAIENHVFLVSSGYDMKTFIVNPAGDVLAEASKENPVVTAELHLDRVINQPWLGNMKNRTWKEWRPDLTGTAPQK